MVHSQLAGRWEKEMRHLHISYERKWLPKRFLGKKLSTGKVKVLSGLIQGRGRPKIQEEKYISEAPPVGIVYSAFPQDRGAQVKKASYGHGSIV